MARREILEKKEKKPGRFLGYIVLYHLLLTITINQIIVMFGIDIDIASLIKLTGYSFGTFVTVWGAVFGSGAIKRMKGAGQ